MSISNNHDRNLEILRSSEYLPAHRVNVIKTGVMNIKPHVRIEAETQSASMTPAEQFDRQVAANLQPLPERPTTSPETLAAVTDLNEYRSKKNVDAIFDSQTYPLPTNFEELLNDAEEAA